MTDPAESGQKDRSKPKDGEISGLTLQPFDRFNTPPAQIRVFLIVAEEGPRGFFTLFCKTQSKKEKSGGLRY
jgi:hypothetical protein